MNKTHWTHPVHARGVKSPQFNTAPSTILTDEKILQYAAKGFYGEREQLKAQAVLRDREILKERKKSLAIKVKQLIDDLD